MTNGGSHLGERIRVVLLGLFIASRLRTASKSTFVGITCIEKATATLRYLRIGWETTDWYWHQSCRLGLPRCILMSPMREFFPLCAEWESVIAKSWHSAVASVFVRGRAPSLTEHVLQDSLRRRASASSSSQALAAVNLAIHCSSSASSVGWYSPVTIINSSLRFGIKCHQNNQHRYSCSNHECIRDFC